MQLYMRRYGSKVITGGTDGAVLAWPLPDKCTLNYLKGEVHLLGSSAISLAEATMYAVQGWILRSDTPADFEARDTLWDSFVPKDNDIVDLDTSTAVDATSMFEMEQVNVAQLMDQEIFGPERIFNMSKLITGLSVFTNLLTSSNTYFPNDLVKLNISKNYKVQDASGILFGVGSPDMASVGVDAFVIPDTTGGSLDAMFTLKHLDDFLDKAMLEITPFTEAGAESPYEDIMAFLLDLLEQVDENGTALFSASSWHVFAKATAGISVPGRLAHTTIGPDAEA